MTIAGYMKTMKGLQVLVFTFPVVSKIFDQRSGWPFPPMGDDALTWRFIAAAIIGTSLLLPYRLLPRKRRRLIIGCLFALFVLSCAAYLTLEGRYVLAVPHSDGAMRYVTRGTERNPELKGPYTSMNDYDLIRNSGQSDWRLERAYKKESLQSNRQKLFWSYVLSLVLLELTLGSVVMRE